MRLFGSKNTKVVRPWTWGEPDDPDTRTQDVVAKLAYEVTNLQGVTEQLQDLVRTFASEINRGTNKGEDNGPRI